jgi:acetamidase/formamidase
VSFGDVHGAQGAGEITGAALEIEAEVEVAMHAREREEAGFVSLPQINTDAAIGSVAGYEGIPRPTARAPRTATPSCGWSATTASAAPRRTSS